MPLSRQCVGKHALEEALPRVLDPMDSNVRDPNRQRLVLINLPHYPVSKTFHGTWSGVGERICAHKLLQSLLRLLILSAHPLLNRVLALRDDGGVDSRFEPIKDLQQSIVNHNDGDVGDSGNNNKTFCSMGWGGYTSSSWERVDAIEGDGFRNGSDCYVVGRRRRQLRREPKGGPYVVEAYPVAWLPVLPVSLGRTGGRQKLFLI